MKYENIFKIITAFGGALASYLFGGWSALLGILLAFVVLDYISGVIAASVEGKLNSAVGAKGIAKKVGIFVIIAVANLVDRALGNAHIFHDTTIFFYLSNELLSIIENSGRSGIPIPEAVKKAVSVLQGKGGVEQ